MSLKLLINLPYFITIRRHLSEELKGFLARTSSIKEFS